MFRQIRLFAFCLSLAMVAVNCQGMIRVALPPVPSLESPTPDDSLRATLGAFLSERLAECPDVMLVGKGRSAAIFGELAGGKRDQAPGTQLEAFSAYLPVDALIMYAAHDGNLRLTISLRGEQTTKTLPYTSNWPPVIYQAADLVGKTLKLSADAQAKLVEDRLGDPEILQVYHASQLESAPWPQNAGAVQLKRLQPVIMRHRDSAPLAAQYLRSVATLINATSREQTYADTALRTVTLYLYPVLGTPYEEAAEALVAKRPGVFEKELTKLAKGLIFAEMTEDAGPLGDVNESLSEEPPITEAMRLGALRLLAVTRARSALDMIKEVAKEDIVQHRMVAAQALQYYEKTDGLAMLRTLASDDDAHVAFIAMVSLWRRGETLEGLLPASRKMIDENDIRYSQPALDVLTALGTADDLPLFRRLLADHDADVRLSALRALTRLNAAEPYGPALLNDPDERLVLHGMKVLSADASKPLTAPLQALANDPYGAIAEAARLALAPCRPTGEREQLIFDLAIEHPYLRNRLVDRLAAMQDPWAVDALEVACATNRNAHTRVYAMTRLLERAPERGKAQLARAMRDPYRWVRLHVAALLATHATPPMAADLRVAIQGEKDAATRLYLEDALARAEGRPLPPPRPAVNSIEGTRNLSWLCGMGVDAERSPFDAYYMFTPKVDDNRKRAHAAGKIIFSRINSVGNSGEVVINQRAADSFWQAIDAELNPENLPYLDGVVLGEESMNTRTDTLWAEGWRPFCLDAGIDPTRVNGDMKTLNRYEQRAWSHWAQERIIDGFNEMYDYIHLKYGKLRPGFKVATFLTEQGGSNVADLRWKFDVGGAYDYKGDPRMAAYTTVRRIKTLWPDRPVLWLSLGIGGYEMNPVRRTQKVPEQPLVDRYNRAYRDAATAYLAGADTGWFSIWMFVEKDFKGGMAQLRGVPALVEDLIPGTNPFENAIKYAWAGAEKDDEEKRPVEITPDEEPALLGEDVLKDDYKSPADIKQDKEDLQARIDRFREGFAFYRNYVYDCARVFASLPRQQVKPAALIVRPDISVWTLPPTRNPLVPGFELLNAYDALADLNQTPGLDLSRYRMIAVRYPGALTDPTIAHITNWLKDTPGLLYVHTKLTTNPADEAGTPQDHDGMLHNAWPWAGDVTTALREGKMTAQTFTRAAGELTVKEAQLAAAFTVQGGNAQVLLSCQGVPCLVLWRKPGYQGAVLFDGISNASQEYLIALRETLNDLHARDGIGLKLDGPILHTALTGPLTIAACTNYYAAVSESKTYGGVDFLTGLPNQPVGRGQATVTAQEYVGKYVAAGGGVTVLGEKPLTGVRTIANGVIVQCAGLMHSGSVTGAVSATTEAGVPLPVVEDVIPWLLHGTEDGIGVLPVGNTGNTITYIRSAGAVRVLQSTAGK